MYYRSKSESVVMREDDKPAPEIEFTEAHKSPEIGAVTFFRTKDVTKEREFIEEGIRERKTMNWGERYAPPVEDLERHKGYRSHISEIRGLVEDLYTQSAQGAHFSDEALPEIVEIEGAFSELYKVEYGEGESLKKLAMLVLTQIRNAVVDPRHIRFLKAVADLLSSQYLIDETAVKEVLKLIDQCGLEKYRGALAATAVRKKYRIVEVEEGAAH